MKKSILFGIALLTAGAVMAQEFPIEWKTKFSFKIDRWYYDDDGTFVLGRADDQVEVLDGKTGEPLWKLSFKNDLKVKALNRAIYNSGEGVVLFFNPDEKKSVGEKVVVDLKTGKELWRADQYAGLDADRNYHFAHCFGDITARGKMMFFNDGTKKITGLDIRTGKVAWESKAYSKAKLSEHVSIESIGNSEYARVTIEGEEVTDTEVLYVNIVTGEVVDEDAFEWQYPMGEFPSEGRIAIRKQVDKTTIYLVGEMAKYSFDTDFTLEASGDVEWKQTFKGKAVRQLWNNAPYVKMDIQGDLIFVMAKEITVFELKTGKKLWSAPFDNCDASIGLRAKQEFGIAGWPLVDGDDVYYVDLNTDNAIKKVNGHTGKLIWKSEKLKSNDRVPNLVIIDNVLVAQFGGLINTQIFIPSSKGGVGDGTYKNENRFDGNFEVRAYDPATGKLIWKTTDLAAKLGDKFKERISTIYPINNKVVVASGENLLCLEPKTGEVVYKTPFAPMKVGAMVEAVVSEDYETLLLFFDKGVASINGATGEVNYSTKTDDIFWKAPGSLGYIFKRGKNTFIAVGEDDFIAFDFAQGKVIGKMENNGNPQFTADGNTIFLRDGSSVTRYTVRK